MHTRKKPDICNDKVLAETMAATGESIKTIQHIINFNSAFIAARVKEGALESVRVPRFGLFRAKLEVVQWRADRASWPKTTWRVGGGPVQGNGLPEDNQQTDQP